MLGAECRGFPPGETKGSLKGHLRLETFRRALFPWITHSALRREEAEESFCAKPKAVILLKTWSPAGFTLRCQEVLSLHLPSFPACVCASTLMKQGVEE